MEISVLVFTCLLAAALCFYLGYRASNKPSLLDQLASLDRERQLLLLTLLGLFTAVSCNVCLICLVVFQHVTDPVVIAMVGTFTGLADAALIGTTYNFWFGSSNGSQLKDAASAAAQAALNAPAADTDKKAA